MNNEARLDDLKRKFYLALLENATLQQLILSTLDQATHIEELPSFSAEPWRPMRDEPRQILGLIFGRSRTQNTGTLSVSLATFVYTEVLLLGVEKTENTLLSGEAPGGQLLHFDASEALIRAEAADRNVRADAAKCFMDAWQTFAVNALLLSAYIDPVLGTFTTEQRSYQIP